jgi:hypothetical protein
MFAVVLTYAWPRSCCRRVHVAGREIELGAGRVAGAVHLLAVRRALVDDDAYDVLGGEELALDVAEARRADRDDRVALELELGLCSREERSGRHAPSCASSGGRRPNARPRTRAGASSPAGGAKSTSSRSAWSIASLAEPGGPTAPRRTVRLGGPREQSDRGTGPDDARPSARSGFKKEDARTYDSVSRRGISRDA